MNKTKYLYLNSRDEFFRLDISKIVYFESDGNYTQLSPFMEIGVPFKGARYINWRGAPYSKSNIPIWLNHSKIPNKSIEVKDVNRLVEHTIGTGADYGNGATALIIDNI